MGEVNSVSVLLPLSVLSSRTGVGGCGRLSLIDVVLQNMFIVHASGSITRAEFFVGADFDFS